MTRTCTICAVAIYTSLQRVICEFMKVHTKPQVTHNLEFLLQQIWVNTSHLRNGCNWKVICHFPYQVLIRKDHWRLIKYFTLKIIGKTGHGHMEQTQCHIHSYGGRGSSVYLQDSVTGPIKSVLRKLLNTTIQPEAGLVILAGNTLGQERLSTISQVGLTSR